MGTLLRSCVVVYEPIKLSFGVVSGVTPGIDVLDEVHVPQWEGAVSGIFQHLNGQNDVLLAQKCIRLVHEKLIIFP